MGVGFCRFYFPKAEMVAGQSLYASLSKHISLLTLVAYYSGSLTSPALEYLLFDHKMQVIEGVLPQDIFGAGGSSSFLIPSVITIEFPNPQSLTI